MEDEEEENEYYGGSGGSFAAGAAVAAPAPPLTGSSGGGTGGTQCRGMYDFSMADDGTYHYITFKEGDVIELLDQSDPEWWMGRFNGDEGYFAANHVSL